MSNPVAAPSNPYSYSTCSTMRAADKRANYLDMPFQGLSIANGLWSARNAFSAQVGFMSTMSSIFQAIITIPLAISGIHSVMHNQYMTGCLPSDIANIEGKSLSEAQDMIHAYHNQK